MVHRYKGILTEFLLYFFKKERNPSELHTLCKPWFSLCVLLYLFLFELVFPFFPFSVDV